jgi:16S rRNA (cytidine1402-2'-O)-methyltransferase
MNSKTGVLYVVATPIGNLGDMTARAVEILSSVDLILAEDTRHASILLRHFDIQSPVWSCHEHNERKQLPAVLERLEKGHSIGLISDAGTPLISDPGYVIVREARRRGFMVSPVPGASALIAALSVSGLPTDRFSFEGFVPTKAGPRDRFLERVAASAGTVVLYESSHRILSTMEAILKVMGPDREVVVARELTKKFEQFFSGTAADVLVAMTQADHGGRGEFVVVIAGAPEAEVDSEQAKKLMSLLLEELPLKSASRVAARWFGLNRNELYQIGLELQRVLETETNG